MRYSKQRTVYFAMYEKVDQWVYDSIYKKLKKESRLEIKALDGFSYDSYIMHFRISEQKYPCSLVNKKLSFKHPKDTFDKIFLFLIKQKFNSLETRILLKQIELERKRIQRLIYRNKPDLLIIPEDSAAVRGRLVATIARDNKITTLVILPLYYEWIIAYPLIGKRLANAWVTMGVNYKERLIENAIAERNIFSRKLIFKTKKAKESKKEKDLLEKEIKKKQYYIGALQNNDEQSLFIQLLVDTFSLIPNKALVFKYHPQTAKAVKDKLKRIYSSKNVYFVDKINLNTLIGYSQGILTISSTCAFCAMQLKKPVIIINSSPFPLQISYLRKKLQCFEVASTPAELSNIIQRLDNPKQRKEYLARQETAAKHYFLYRHYGLEDRDLVRLIQEMAKADIKRQAVY